MVSSGQSSRLVAQTPTLHLAGFAAGQETLFNGQSANEALQEPSPQRIFPLGHLNKGRQSSLEGTQRPSAQGSKLPAGSLRHWLISIVVKNEGQSVIDFEQVPSMHLIGVCFGHVATGHLPFLGSMQSPVAQRSGASGGHPIMFGQLVRSDEQDPSGQRTSPFPQLVVSFLHSIGS